MFKRILVPVDPAKPFAAANQYAVDLAHKFDCQIVSTYIIDEQQIGPIGAEAAQALDDALEWVGRDAMDDFIRHHKDLTIQKTLAYGHTPTALFQMVLQTGADIVVVGGYHGTSTPHLWGSTVEEVVHHTERPTFVVRKPAELPGVGQAILVPFDGSERVVSTLPKVVKLAAALDATIQLVYVCRQANVPQSKTMLEKGIWICQEAGVDATSVVLQKSLIRSKGKTILDHARKNGNPLIALSRLGRHGMETGHSRTVGWLVAHSDVPIWVVRK